MSSDTVLADAAETAAAPSAPDGLTWTPAWRIAELIRNKDVSPVEVTEHFIDRVETLNPVLHGLSYMDAKGALETARAAEKAVLNGEALGSLHGVPTVVKDRIPIAGMPYYEGAPSKRDHFGVERLRRAGAVLLGVNSMMTSGGGGQVKAAGVFGGFNWDAEALNPWDTSRTPGWSSSGGAASVVSGMIPFAIGSDGGGSTRLPAAYSGCIGVHPTSGLIPEVYYAQPRPPAGLTIGPMTRDVRDAALVTQILAGPDGRDPFCIQADPDDYLVGMDLGVEGMNLAWTDDFGFTGRYAADESPRVIEHVRRQAMALAGLGARIEVTDEVWEDFWPGRHAQWQAFTPTAGLPIPDEEEMAEGFEARGRNWDRFRRLFAGHDLLLSVTSQRLAMDIPTWEAAWTTAGPSYPNGSFMGCYCSHTEMFNWMKFPAVSVPAGFVDGLPVGLQIAGPPSSEAKIFRVAQAFVKAFPQTRRPPIS